ncbi:MAG TPA: hypothetical protein VF838_14485 [Trebonia sp.]
MIRARNLLVATAALPLLAFAAPVGAATTTTYHGTFTSVTYTNCAGGTPPVAAASGVWSISAHGTSDATLAVNIFVAGSHHVSFGGPVAQTTIPGATVAVEVPTLAGPLVVSVTGQALSYKIAPYDFNGLTCDSVLYSGVLDH